MDVQNSDLTTGLKNLFSSGRRYELEKGEFLPINEVNDSLFLITEGYVKRYLITNDGSIAVQIIHGPGGVLPLTPIFKDFTELNIYEGPEKFFYETMTNVIYHTIKFSDLQTELEKSPLLYRDLLKISAGRIRYLVHTLENQAMRGAYNRVAHQLLHFANTFGTTTLKGIKINLPLTQSDIASTLSITRETTSSAITRLNKTGIIKTGRNILITDKERLSQEAYK